MNNIKRDTSGAVINQDREALNKYKLQRKYNRKIDNLEKEVKDMKKQIHTLLRKITQLEQS